MTERLEALEALDAAASARIGVELAVGAAVLAARAAGASWRDIARVLGTSRQAAWERYGQAE